MHTVPRRLLAHDIFSRIWLIARFYLHWSLWNTAVHELARLKLNVLKNKNTPFQFCMLNTPLLWIEKPWPRYQPSFHKQLIFRPRISRGGLEFMILTWLMISLFFQLKSWRYCRCDIVIRYCLFYAASCTIVIQTIKCSPFCSIVHRCGHPRYCLECPYCWLGGQYWQSWGQLFTQYFITGASTVYIVTLIE